MSGENENQGLRLLRQYSKLLAGRSHAAKNSPSLNALRKYRFLIGRWHETDSSDNDGPRSSRFGHRRFDFTGIVCGTEARKGRRRRTHHSATRSTLSTYRLLADFPIRCSHLGTSRHGH
jgi:hypothetical protein